MTDAAAGCAFSRALLAGEAGCTLARRGTRGEWESIACASPVASINCGTLLALLRERSTFALKLPPPSRPMPHVQSMRLQCGGATALARALGAAKPDDIHQLVAEARARWGDLSSLPFALVVADLAAWTPHRRSRSP